VTHAPVIIIFGAAVRPDGSPSRTLRDRVAAALACGSRLRDARYMPTGAVGRYGASEASVMAALLREAGAPADRIVREETGVDTLSSARACARLLRERAFAGPVFVATSTYHLPRCIALLRLCGVRARPCTARPVPPASHAGKRWYWRVREAFALPYDVLAATALRALGRL
jgi:vancomycin permeability regulator SanA